MSPGTARSSRSACNDQLTVLSMHQPWASLLVWGVKRIEGRHWPTEHRGRLWIHSTSQPMSPGLLEEIREFYAVVYSCQGAAPAFPEHYPTGALLGCVDVVGCMTEQQLQAWEGLPDSLKLEAQAPYGFLCERPRRLCVPQQMRGFPKLWKLPRAVAAPLEPALRPAPQAEGFTWSVFLPASPPKSTH